jgi:hypothetical protein
MVNDYDAMMGKMDSLNTNQKKDLAVKTINDLSANDKNDVANRTGLGPPSKRPTDAIWLIIVIAFVFIAIISASSITYGVVFLQRTADNVQIVLTIFTTVAGFVVGLVSPSPIPANKGNNP